MTLIRWNPWNDLSALHGQMDQLFGSAFGGEAPDGGSPVHLPVDIRQTDDAYIIEASVAGFTPDEVELTFEEGVLTIRGSHQTETDGDGGGYVRRERRISSFYRQVGLPAEVRSDEISASYEHGVLTVTVPRAKKAEPKRIPVVAPKRSATSRVVDAVKGAAR